VKPDGYGVWTEAGTEVAFFLEYDRGTETHERLAAKLDGYATMASASKDRFCVLFWFPGPKREAAARNRLASAPQPVATGCQGEAPASAVWLPVGPTESRRRRLADLPATVPGPRATG